jgi:hypothetical protein
VEPIHCLAKLAKGEVAASQRDRIELVALAPHGPRKEFP